MSERREDVGIVVSELLTNALCHALPGQADPQARAQAQGHAQGQGQADPQARAQAQGHAHAQGQGQGQPEWPVQLGLLQPGSCVLCAVADPSPSAPVPRTPAYLAETGRGLQIVGVLSDEWGYITCVTPNSTVKVVWAMFMTRR